MFLKQLIEGLKCLFLICSVFTIPAGCFCQSSGHSRQFSSPILTDFKIFTRSYGTIIGLQRGKFNFIEIGFEHHWKKITLVKPKLYSVGGNFEYNFWENVLGYKASFFTKPGRLALTYGVNLLYYTDFNTSKFGAGPVIGFKILGFHLLTGVNILTRPTNFEGNNVFFIGLRYYIPLENKIKFKKSNP